MLEICGTQNFEGTQHNVRQFKKKKSFLDLHQLFLITTLTFHLITNLFVDIFNDIVTCLIILTTFCYIALISIVMLIAI